MPVYTGRSADGSDMKEIKGAVYMNPDNENEWSNLPYPSQAMTIRIEDELIAYMDGRFTLSDVYNQILNKECPLSRRVRDYVLDHYV